LLLADAVVEVVAPVVVAVVEETVVPEGGGVVAVAVVVVAEAPELQAVTPPSRIATSTKATAAKEAGRATLSILMVPALASALAKGRAGP
jgi:hypothetical protein